MMSKNILIALLILVLCETAKTQSIPAAKALMDTAFSKAKKEKKNVFVIFTASWCTPCQFMKYFISDIYNKQYFEDNYVIVDLYVWEVGSKKNNNNPGTKEILKDYGGDTTGIPYSMIFNADGKKLAAFLDAPVNPNDIPAFIKCIKQTSRLKDFELKMIAERIKQLSRNSELY